MSRLILVSQSDNVKCRDVIKVDGYNNGNMSQNNDIFIFGLQEKNNRYAGVPSTFTRNVSHTNTTYKKVPLPTLLTQAQLEILLAWLESWR